MAGTWAIGSVCGPLIGGTFAGQSGERLGESSGFGGWRFLFWINVPIAGIAFVALPLLLRLEQPMKNASLCERIKSIDWVGAVLWTGSTTTFLIPVTWGGVQYPWTFFHTLLPLTFGLLGFGIWVWWELYTTHPCPLIRLAIFNNCTAAASYFGIAIQGVILWSLLFYLPLYYEACHFYSPLKSGLALLPETCLVAPAALVAGMVISKAGKYRWSIWTGWVVSVIGLGLMWFLDEDTESRIWIPLNVLPGIVIGLLFPDLEYATQAAAGQKDVAYAAAMYNFIRAFGQGVGVAIGGSVFQGQLEKRLMSHPETKAMAEEYARDAAALVQIMKAIGNSEEEIGVLNLLRHSYADSLKVLWVVMAGLSGIALLIGVLTRELGIEEELDSRQGMRSDQANGKPGA